MFEWMVPFNDVKSIYQQALLELRRIGLIHKYLTVDAAKTIVCSLVLSRLDYCNSILSGSLKCLIQKLQRVQNTAARITLRMPRTNILCLFWEYYIGYQYPVELLTRLTFYATLRWLLHIQNICQSCWMCIHQQDHCAHHWIQISSKSPQQGQSHMDSEHLPTRDQSTGTGSLAALELLKKRTVKRHLKTAIFSAECLR